MFKRLLILSLFCALSGSALMASVGVVSAARGDASLLRSGSAVPLKLGEKLEEKDIITTGSDAKVQLTFNDRTIITIGKNSRFSIEEYFFDTSKASKLKFQMSKGFFRSVSGKIGKIVPQRFKLQTKNATIGIRGTEIVIETDPERGDRIACTMGRIYVLTNRISTPLEVDAGNMVTVKPNSFPTKPISIEKSGFAVSFEKHEKEREPAAKPLLKQYLNEAQDDEKESGLKEETEEIVPPQNKENAGGPEQSEKSSDSQEHSESQKTDEGASIGDSASSEESQQDSSSPSNSSSQNQSSPPSGETQTGNGSPSSSEGAQASDDTDRTPASRPDETEDTASEPQSTPSVPSQDQQPSGSTQSPGDMEQTPASQTDGTPDATSGSDASNDTQQESTSYPDSSSSGSQSSPSVPSQDQQPSESTQPSGDMEQTPASQTDGTPDATSGSQTTDGTSSQSSESGSETESSQSSAPSQSTPSGSTGDTATQRQQITTYTYDEVSYGYWTGSDGNPPETWFEGTEKTSSTVMMSKKFFGSKATYKGGVTAVTNDKVADGQITMNFDFWKETFDGSMNFQADGEPKWSVTMQGGVDAGHFESSQVQSASDSDVAGIGGSLEGDFYGKFSPENIGGHFELTSPSHGTAEGVFGGTKQ